MKRLILILATVLLSAVSAVAQDYLWPIEAKTAGEDVVSAPQSYIGDELNFSNLFITAPRGTKILSPVDGTIYSISMGYLQSLTYSLNYGFDSDKNFDEYWEAINSEGTDVNTKFLTGCIGIKPNDNPSRTIWINGLCGDYSFKTGQEIKQGDVIGEISYSYHKFNDPTINVSISKNGKVDDPMTPFGITSAFVAAKDQKPIESITKEQAREDINVLYDATIEIFPSLNTLMTNEETEALRQKMLHYVDTLSGEKVPAKEFISKLSGEYNNKIWDSHISWQTPAWQKDDKNKYRVNDPSVLIGFEDDTLRIYSTIDSKKEYVGREVVEINGFSADSLRKLIAENIKSYDALVRSNLERAFAFNGFTLLQSLKDFKGEYNLVLDGGEKVTFGLASGRGKYTDIDGLLKYLNTNRYKSLYDTRMINDSVAYLGIFSFQLSEVTTEEIASFVDSVSKAKVENLIVDVRNNSGGDIEVLTRLSSLFLSDTLRLPSYDKVNSNDIYLSLKHSTNYSDEMYIFRDYEPREGMEGFYKEANSYYAPSADSIHYGGRLYILTNENSVSAATLFPSIMVRARRGVSVGRETPTAYHYMTAMKFASMLLPNTKLPLTLPMVQSVFDTVVNERVPYGRGLLPDYEVELTHDEILYKSGDTILKHTLQLIDQGRYLPLNDPFEVKKKEDTGSLLSTYKYYLIGGLVLLVLVLLLFRKRK